MTEANPLRAEPGSAYAVIGGGYHTAVTLMRNLVRRGVKACCVDFNPAQPAFLTVHGPAHLCPHPDDEPGRWLQFMLDLAAKLPPRPVFLCSADIYVTALATHAEELSKHYVFCLESAALQGLLASKQRQYALAEANGMPVPLTRFVGSMEEVAAFSSMARFPCVLKPLHSRDWERLPPGHPLAGKKVARANSQSELIAHYEVTAKVAPEVVVQETIEGPDTAKLVYLSCYSRAGHRIGMSMMYELRTSPIHFGSASVVEPVDDPETAAVCDAFLQRIGYTGLCEIELKRDSRDGRVKMIEANPRYTGTSDSTPYVGVDLGWLHYLDLTGKRVTPVQTSVWDRRHIVLTWDFPAIPSYVHEGLLTWRQVFHSYRPPVAFLDFDWTDCRVSLATVIRLCRVIVGAALRGFKPLQ